MAQAMLQHENDILVISQKKLSFVAENCIPHTSCLGVYSAYYHSNVEVVYILHLHLHFHAGIDAVRNATKLQNLFSVYEECFTYRF